MSEVRHEAARDRRSGQTTFVCPMHPEVVSDSADRCPKCGMKLVPANLVGSSEHEHHGHGGHEGRHGHGGAREGHGHGKHKGDHKGTTGTALQGDMSPAATASMRATAMPPWKQKPSTLDTARHHGDDAKTTAVPSIHGHDARP